MVYYRRRKGLPPLNDDTTWFTFTIRHILQNPAYTGQLVSQRNTTPSYKNHKRTDRPKEEWVIVEDHHEPIIDAESFEVAQKLHSKRRRPNKVGEFTALSGLIWCPDCNSRLSISCNTSKYQYFVCSLYRNSHKHYRVDCTRHGIRREDLEQLVLEKITEVLDFAHSDNEKFAEAVRKVTNKDSERIIKNKSAELAKADGRIAELDMLIRHVYEDNVLGKLSDKRFATLLGGYEREQAELISATAALRTEVEEIKTKSADVQEFLRIVEQYKVITELTAVIARTFIEKIIVHEPVYRENSNVKLSQEIQIFFNCIGEFNHK